MSIEELPLMRDIRNFAESLPSDKRLGFYENLQGVYSVGVADGILTMNGLNDNVDSWHDYFSRMKQELRS